MNPAYEGLGLIELLDLLEAVPEPKAISMLPQTVGWVWLLVALTLFVGTLWRFLKKKTRANAYRKAALAALETSGDDPAVIADILRRTALVAYPRETVAGLHGDIWLGFLDATFDRDGFMNGPSQVLASAPYKASPADEAVTELARAWIRGHDPHRVVSL